VTFLTSENCTNRPKSITAPSRWRLPANSAPHPGPDRATRRTWISQAKLTVDQPNERSPASMTGPFVTLAAASHSRMAPRVVIVPNLKSSQAPRF
jgi:hypothetical protein